VPQPPAPCARALPSPDRDEFTASELRRVGGLAAAPDHRASDRGIVVYPEPDQDGSALSVYDPEPCDPHCKHCGAEIVRTSRRGPPPEHCPRRLPPGRLPRQAARLIATQVPHCDE
jgi:hypothetical protein